MQKVILLAILAVAAFPYGAAAQSIDETFVQTTGSDAAACSRAAPCKTFQAAHDLTNAGGQITALDSGDFGPVTITKGLTIVGGGVEAIILAASGNAITVNAPVNAGVGLGGLRLIGKSTGSAGIQFNSGASLVVSDCIISSFTVAGVKFSPSNPGAKLWLRLSGIHGNGAGGTTGAAVLISPQAGGTAQAVLKRVAGSANVFGLAVDGTGSTGGINVTVRESEFMNGRQDGIIAVTPGGGAPISVLVDSSGSANNAGYGVRAVGNNVTIRLNRSNVAGNGTGIAGVGGGSLLSYGTNTIDANVTNGAPTGSVALQ
jgi:hypothetical protein